MTKIVEKIKGFFKRKDKKSPKDEDLDPEMAEFGEIDKQFKSHKVRQLKKRLVQLKQEQYMRELQEKIDDLEDDLYDNDLDDEPEEKINPVDAINNPDTLLTTLLINAFSKGSLGAATKNDPPHISRSPTPPEPPTPQRNITDEELKILKKSIPDDKIKVLRGMTDEQINLLLNRYYPEATNGDKQVAIQMLREK